MLVLARRVGEEVLVDGDITIKLLRIDGDSVRIGIEAPKDVDIVRSELLGESHE